MSLQTAEKHQITFPPADTLGDSCVALSPDAGSLVFCRCSHMGGWLADIYVVKLATQLQPIADPQRLVPGHPLYVNGITWTRTGTEIVFGANRPDFAEAIWRLPVPNPSGSPASEVYVGSAQWPSAARLSSHLAFSRVTGAGLNIWRLGITGVGKAHGQPALLIESTRGDFAPRYSPDGKRIAFESNRTGNLEIWTCNSEGRDCQQLTNIGTAFTGLPSWSPDGKQVAFYSRVGEKSHIFVTGADGTRLRQITFGDSNELMPRWSRNGEWIYFSSSATKPVQIWKISPQGGTPVQVTSNGGFASLESPDGQWLYYTKNEAADTSLWKVATGGGEEVQVLPSVHFHNFDVTSDGIYFLEGWGWRTAQPTTLRFQGNGGQISTVAHLPQGYVGLSVSPDRKWIVFTANKAATSELIMIEDFQ
jgi:Tol biopolymer transport system component